MADCKRNHKFENWSHSLKFRPDRFCEPRTEARISEIVREASRSGKKVRTQGAGHSFSQLLATADTLVSLDEMDVLRDLDQAIRVSGQQATVPAGARLKHLIPALRRRGLGFRNIGSITQQSIAGAVSTGTHGTGRRLASISSQVSGVRLVDGSGTVREITARDAEVLEAARISLGTLGIMTEVTLDCVADYQLEFSAYLCSFDDVVPELERLSQENERMLIWWLLFSIGPRDKVILITKNPVGHPPGLLADADDVAVKFGPDTQPTSLPKDSEMLEDLIQESGGIARGRFKKILSYIGDYDHVLTIPLLPVYHRECEYAIPAGEAATALRSMRSIFEEGDFSLRLPVEVRFVARDATLLSPANGRDVCYIGASTQDNSTEVFERFEPLMWNLDGRPHWGKNFTITRDDVRRMYAGSYDAFRAVRSQFDPNRVFTNTLLEDLIV